MHSAYAYTPPRPDPQAEREAKERDAARARHAALVEQAIKAEEMARFETQVRAVSSDLFSDDPEIKALTADHEVKKRQRPVLALANPQLTQTAAENLRAGIKLKTFEAVIAAIEDLADGDPTLQRAMVLQRQIDEDTRKLELLNIVLERLNRHGLANVAREREQQAYQALEAALMERKSQWVLKHAEHPEVIDQPASETSPIASDVVEV